MSTCKFVGRYNDFRWLCSEVKTGDIGAVNQAVELMLPFVSKDMVLIPIPSRFGYATWSMMIAWRLALRSGCKVKNMLFSKPRESVCDLKNAGLKPKLPEFGYKGVVTKERYVLVDNVYDSGMTYRAACKALGRRCEILVIAKT